MSRILPFWFYQFRVSLLAKLALLLQLAFLPFNTSAQLDFRNQLTNEALDTLHIYPSKYLNNKKQGKVGLFKGTPVSENLVASYGLKTLYPAERYTIPVSFYLDKEKTLNAFVLACDNNKELEGSFMVLVVLSEENEVIFHHKLAWYEAIEGTMEYTCNAWIYDEDKDGDLDFVQIHNMVDYELPNEFADNISGVDGSFFRLKENTYIQEYLTKEQYHSFSVIK